ncbi:hypothetical protein [Variovorax sp. PAMC 28711]|uniref:hypothetical protein n=1 Tax=Variovorax sp. PAMC 28711 TaxID=1795631 RepID=UPI00078B2F57|nr:hypothetical protein [Variovorax sp. PAMC 28711]AMM24818.1 hypothetical protein AX767_10970 [Variovorax sp. PAMC 28711]
MTKSIASTVLATLALCFIAGCASGNSSNTGASASSGSRVEVFGTIDSSISHVTNKSAPAR